MINTKRSELAYRIDEILIVCSGRSILPKIYVKMMVTNKKGKNICQKFDSGKKSSLKRQTSHIDKARMCKKRKSLN